MLRAQLAKKEAVSKRFRKEREEKVMKAYQEKQELLRQIVALKKENEIAANSRQPKMVEQVEQPKRQEQKLLETQKMNLQGPVIQKIRNYPPLEVDNNQINLVKPVVGAMDKGKLKESGIKISEPVNIVQIYGQMFGSKGNKREESKTIGGKNKESTEMNQILNAIKGLNFPQMKNDRNPTHSKIPYQSNFNRQNRLQNFP